MGAAVTHSPELNSNLVVPWNEPVRISCGLAVYNHWNGLVDWTQSGGLAQTAIKMPFQCRTETYAAYHFAKVAPLACLQLVWTPDWVRSAVQTWSQWDWPLS